MRSDKDMYIFIYLYMYLYIFIYIYIYIYKPHACKLPVRNAISASRKSYPTDISFPGSNPHNFVLEFHVHPPEQH